MNISLSLTIEGSPLVSLEVELNKPQNEFLKRQLMFLLDKTVKSFPTLQNKLYHPEVLHHFEKEVVENDLFHGINFQPPTSLHRLSATIQEIPSMLIFLLKDPLPTQGIANSNSLQEGLDKEYSLWKMNGSVEGLPEGYMCVDSMFGKVLYRWDEKSYSYQEAIIRNDGEKNPVAIKTQRAGKTGPIFLTDKKGIFYTNDKGEINQYDGIPDYLQEITDQYGVYSNSKRDENTIVFFNEEGIFPHPIHISEPIDRHGYKKTLSDIRVLGKNSSGYMLIQYSSGSYDKSAWSASIYESLAVLQRDNLLTETPIQNIPISLESFSVYSTNNVTIDQILHLTDRIDTGYRIVSYNTSDEKKQYGVVFFDGKAALLGQGSTDSKFVSTDLIGDALLLSISEPKKSWRKGSREKTKTLKQKV